MLYGDAGNDTFVFASLANQQAAGSISGGDGTDTLKYNTDAAVAAADLTKINSIEKISMQGATSSVTLTDAVYTANGLTSLTVDGNALTTKLTVDASALTAANSVTAVLSTADGLADSVLGGAGNDTVTAGTGTDNIDGGAGNDTIGFAAVSSFTTADTINGGFGTDSLDLSAVVLEATTSLDDSAFAGLTSIETFKAWTFNDAGDNSTSAITATISLGTKAQTAGITTIALSATDGSTTQANNADTYTFIVDASAYTTGVTVTTNHAAAAGSASNTLNVQVTTGTGNDTITAAAGDDAITVNGGAAPIPLT